MKVTKKVSTVSVKVQAAVREYMVLASGTDGNWAYKASGTPSNLVHTKGYEDEVINPPHPYYASVEDGKMTVYDKSTGQPSKAARRHQRDAYLGWASQPSYSVIPMDKVPSMFAPVAGVTCEGRPVAGILKSQLNPIASEGMKPVKRYVVLLTNGAIVPAHRVLDSGERGWLLNGFPFDKEAARLALGMKAEKVDTKPALVVKLNDPDEPPPGNKHPDRASVTTSRVIRNTRASKWVKQAHRFQCQIKTCNFTLTLKNGDKYAEAHHLHPMGGKHKGPDEVENIVCVCPNHHAELDKGVRRLEVEGLRLNKTNGHNIAEIHIAYHNEVVYGNGLSIEDEIPAKKSKSRLT